MNGIADAYSATGAAWERGPGRIYNRLAEVVVARSPVSLRGRRVVDLGAGTGAASRAIAAVGGRAVAVDPAFGMLATDRLARPAAVRADARALPVADGSCDGIVAAFSINHVPNPETALRECVRACAPGSPIVASTYAADDAHPAKSVVLDVLRDHGFEPAGWAVELYRDMVPLLADAARCASLAADAGLDARVEALDVDFPDLGPDDLVEWRLGMAQHAPFVASLPSHERGRVRAEAAARLVGAPTLVRSILVISAVRP